MKTIKKILLKEWWYNLKTEKEIRQENYKISKVINDLFKKIKENKKNKTKKTLQSENSNNTNSN